MSNNVENTMFDAGRFHGGLLDRLDTFNAQAKSIAEGLHEIADAMRLLMAQNGAFRAGAKVAQKKEASSSSPLSSPLKEGEESSKEEEETYPPIIPPSPSEENLCVENARAKEAQMMAQAEEVEQLFKVFWDAYDYKRGKDKAGAAWKSLSKKDREAALAGVAPYRADCDRFQRPQLYPQGYLNQRRWEDDFNSGLRNADIKNGRNKIFTREDIRKLEQQQRLETAAELAAEYRAGLV